MQDRAPSTRREFLRRSAALGAASFAVPYLIPRDVLAAPGKAGANDRIGVAGIGIGRQGSGDLAQALKSRDTQFIAIADVNRKRAAAIAKGSGEPNRNKVGKVTEKQVEEIARLKMPDLNAHSIGAAIATVKGTARSMGLDVVA